MLEANTFRYCSPLLRGTGMSMAHEILVYPSQFQTQLPSRAMTERQIFRAFGPSVTGDQTCATNPLVRPQIQNT